MAILSNNIELKVLFNLIAEGNEKSFKILFEQYRYKTYAVAFKWTKSALAAEEISQEVFISIWISRAQLSLVKDPAAYIYTVIYNQVNRYLKKEENRNRILQLYWWTKNTTSNCTEETIHANESQQIINVALAKLSPQKRLIFTLSRQYGQTYNEIGESLHLSPHTVKSHLVQTVKFIRNYMELITTLLIGVVLILFF